MMSKNGYKKIKQVGIGSTAVVYQGQEIETNQDVAIKIIRLTDVEEIEHVTHEVIIQRQLRHPNVSPMITCFTDEDELWIVMELYYGSIRDLLDTTYKTGFDVKTVATILKQTLLGLEYIHKKCIHRDIKASNLLLSKEGQIKVADFGVSKFNEKRHSTFTGTLCWMAPEMLEQVEYTNKVDLWSVGITALELMFGYAPYAKYNPLKAMIFILQEEPPTVNYYLKGAHSNLWINKKVPECFSKFLKKCLQKDPTKRSSIKDLLKTPFITKNAVDLKTLIDI